MTWENALNKKEVFGKCAKLLLNGVVATETTWDFLTQENIHESWLISQEVTGCQVLLERSLGLPP